MINNQTSKKLKLMNVLPEGLIISRAWLENKGFSRPDIDYYLRAGHLQAVKRGLYRKPGAILKWQQVAFSLQEIGYISHVGGLTALAERGLVHYLEMGDRDIQVFSAHKLPKWLETWQQEQKSDFYFSIHTKKWIQNLPKEAFNSIPFGSWDWPIKTAQPELAIIEMLSEAKSTTDLQVIDSIFDGLTTLSPNRLQLVLENCDSIQTKRLFGWFSDRHSHPWLKRLEWHSLELGNGKRAFIKGGVLSKKWQITVPREMEQNYQIGDGFESEQSLF